MRTLREVVQCAAKYLVTKARLRRLASAILFIGVMNQLVAQTTPISSVDTSLVGSQKYLLRVGGKPYYMTSVQMRFDKLRYTSTYQWTWAQCDALMAQAASDGFNTVGIPIQWYEVEPTMNTFDWTILDNYLSMVNKYNLKMELLWFGANSTGTVGYMGDSANPVHLRTPDYVLYAPTYNSTATTSNYTIARSVGNYTLDMADTNLQARETYVLGQVMAHIAAWDAANGATHPVIGVQVDNEPDNFSNAEIVTYLNGVASAVKNSSYVVWTRLNTPTNATSVSGRIAANEALRTAGGTNIDFIGEDDYSTDPTVLEPLIPAVGYNYRMIMENGGEGPVSDRLSVIYGDEGYSLYNMCGPDTGNGLYVQTTQGVCTPWGSNITGIRLVNHMLDTDTTDLALNSNGKGLFVHNWTANSTAATTGGTLGLTYTPTSISDEGISIRRSDTQIVLMSTGGGTFTYPSSYLVSSASQGYFDTNNAWVNQGSVAFTSTSITMVAGQTVLLTYVSPIPAAPTTLTVTGVSNAEVNLSWTGSTYAAGYNVKRGTVSGGPYTTVATGVISTTYADTGLANGTTYYYVVSAVNATGESANSSQVSGEPVVGAINVPNYSFETPATTTYSYNPAGASWTFSGATPSGSGVTTNGSGFTAGNSVAPDGTQVGFIEETGTITQTLTGFTPGTAYKIYFLASQRQKMSTGVQLGETFDVRMDGTTLVSLVPAQSAAGYVAYSANFTATNTSHTLAFVGTNLNGTDNTVFIDKVQVLADGTSSIALSVPAINIAQGTIAVLKATGTFAGTAPSSPLIFSVDSGVKVTGTCVTTSTTISCTAAYPASTLAAGSHTITAQYPGDVTYAPVSSTGTLTVGSAPVVQVQYAMTTLVYPGSTDVTTCVSATSGAVPTGTIQLYDGTTLLTTLTLQSNGCVSWYISPGLAVGSHQIAAAYSGDGNYPTETSVPTAITVTTAPALYSFTPYSYSYGSVKEGVAATAVFTLTNADTVQHSITSIKLTAESTNSYSSTTNCPTTILAKATCTVTVTFKPTALGLISTTLTAIGGGGTTTSAISGTGVLKSNVVVSHSDQTLFVYPTDLSTQPVSSTGGGIGVAVDSSGSILSIDIGGSSLSKFSDAGTLLGSLTGGGLNGALAFAVDGLSNVWVANGNGTLSAFNSSGTAISSTSMSAAGKLSHPVSIGVDAAGSLWVANAGNNTVTEIIGIAAPAAPLVQQVVQATPGTRP